jgi:hypothetical protein
MKNNFNAIEKGLKVFALCLVFAFTSTVQVMAQCPGNVDLEATSMDPASPVIQVGQTTQIIVAMSNNGPCVIPTGEATLQITMSSVAFDIGVPFNLVDFCSPQWTYLGVITNATQHNLFFQNNGGPIPVGSGLCYFQFDIKGKAITTNSPITLASSLSATATSSDVNPVNQSVSTTLTVTTPLAIKLSNFDGSIKDCNTVLNWKTASEENFDRFEIEYSTDGRVFNKVGTVLSKNTNATSTSYQFVHNQLNTKAYYRLKLVDKDGKINYTRVLPITNQCRDAFASIYPMPVNSSQLATLTLKNLKGKIVGEMFTQEGKIVNSFVFVNGSNSVNVSKLPAGSYYLKVKDADGFVQSLKVIVVRGQ